MSSSFRHILRATAIVGGASAINILIGIARNKVAALLLGPAGVGVIGLLLNLVTAIANFVGLGVTTSGVRALASAPDELARSRSRQALSILTLALSVIGGTAVWLLRNPIAKHVLGDAGMAWQVGWLAPAAAFTIWSAMQIALLNGMRRLGDLAKVQVVGAALGTVFGITALVVLGRDRGILAFVIAAPLGMVLAGWAYTLRIPRIPSSTPRDRAALSRDIRVLISLGMPMMLGGLAMPIGLLIIRSLISNRIGTIALGQFTAAWTLSATYVGFVLAAMGTDYFPRLSAAIEDRDTACRMVNDQAEVALLLALPVMLSVQAVAPWLLQILYAKAFMPAADILRWQIAGDVLKIVSWPLAFVILAQGRGKMFWIIEAVLMSAMTAIVAIGIRPFGLAAAGIGYALAYALYLPILLVATRYLIDFRYNRRVLVTGLLGLVGVALVGLAGAHADLAGLVVGGLLAATAGLHTLYRLKSARPVPVSPMDIHES